MKKRHLLFCLLLTICFVSVAKIPIRLLLESSALQEYAEELNVLIKVIIFLFATHLLARKYNLLQLGGFKRPLSKNYWLLLLPFLYPGVWPLSTISSDCIQNFPYLFVTMAMLILHALAEEVVFRGVIQGYLLKNNINKSFHFIALTTSILFALSHLINLKEGNLPSVLNQMVYAFFMGMLFSALLLRTNNVWLLGIVHGLMNFIFTMCSDTAGTDPDTQGTATLLESLVSMATLSLFFSPILLIYWFLTRGVKLPVNPSR